MKCFLKMFNIVAIVLTLIYNSSAWSNEAPKKCLVAIIPSCWDNEDNLLQAGINWKNGFDSAVSSNSGRKTGFDFTYQAASTSNNLFYDTGKQKKCGDPEHHYAQPKLDVFERQNIMNLLYVHVENDVTKFFLVSLAGPKNAPIVPVPAELGRLRGTHLIANSSIDIKQHQGSFIGIKELYDQIAGCDSTTGRLISVNEKPSAAPSLAINSDFEPTEPNSPGAIACQASLARECSPDEIKEFQNVILKIKKGPQNSDRFSDPCGGSRQPGIR